MADLNAFTLPPSICPDAPDESGALGLDTWTELVDELRADLDSDPTQWIGVLTLRPQDRIRWNACFAQAMVQMVPGGHDWSTPAARRLKSDLTAWVRKLFHAADGAVTFTSNGTESNFLALRAMRNWWRKEHGSTATPDIVVPYSMHPSVDKAAADLDIRVVRTSLTPEGRADPVAMEQAVGPRTMGICCSVPSDSRGLCDPVSSIAAIAERAAIWCHVDACLGGYLVPYLRRTGRELPAFDFSVPAVRSLAADLHKYGYAPIGLSTLILRDRSDIAHQRFEFDGWDGPAMVSDTVNGTSSFAALAGAWVTVRQLGEAGYLARARDIARNMDRLADAIAAVPEVVLLGKPEAGMIHFGAKSHASRFAAWLKATGYRGTATTSPAGFIVCVGTRWNDTEVSGFLAAVAQCANSPAGDSDRAGRFTPR